MSDVFPDRDGSEDIDQSVGAAGGPEGLDETGEGPQDGPDLSATAPPPTFERTGNPVVDSVLDSLRELEDVPVSEHVAVFEAAHERLRGALGDAGEAPAES